MNSADQQALFTSAIHADPDDVRAQSDLICAPQSVIAEESSPAQNGGPGSS